MKYLNYKIISKLIQYINYYKSKNKFYDNNKKYS